MLRLVLSLSLFILPCAAIAQDMSLVVEAGADKEKIDDAFTLDSFGCTGANRSPAVQWTKGPDGTRSYALTVFDPDAPTGSGWWHWTVFNIPPDNLSLPEGASGSDSLSKEIIEGRNDFGSSSYGGPCPPQGDTHHYVFTIWALGVEKLPIDANASGAMSSFLMRQNALASASTTLSYTRP